MSHEYRQHMGKKIAFHSIKNGPIEAMLISVSNDHIQVRLLHDLRTETRLWCADSIRLFDSDKISDVRLITTPAPMKFDPPTPTYQDVKRKRKRSSKSKGNDYNSVRLEANKRLAAIKEKDSEDGLR
jgi:hypothetical protein